MVLCKTTLPPTTETERTLIKSLNFEDRFQSLYARMPVLHGVRSGIRTQAHIRGYSKTRYKKLVIRVEPHASAVSLVESGEERSIKAIKLQAAGNDAWSGTGVIHCKPGTHLFV